MRKRATIFTLFLFVAICTAASDQAAKIAPTGAWLQRDVRWANAPPEVNPSLQTAEARVLFFKPDHTFAIIHCVVNRVPKQYMTISHGDGQIIQMGQWQAVGSQISTTFQLVSRTVEAKGQKVPGEQRAIIKKSGDSLVLKGKSYRRADALDESATEIVNAIKNQS